MQIRGLNRFFLWNRIAVYGRSKILRTSYIWLLIVPVAYRIIEKIESPLVLTGLADGLVLNIDLPFSWKIFYFAALSIAVATVIFTEKCPDIIRLEDFNGFQRKGYDVRYLAKFAEIEGRTDLWEIDTPLKDYKRHRQLPKSYLFPGGTSNYPSGNADKDKAMENVVRTFWNLFGWANNKDFKFRMACAFFYGVGFTLLSVVAAQNIWFVISSAF
jgi:hypothetical protein